MRKLLQNAAEHHSCWYLSLVYLLHIPYQFRWTILPSGRTVNSPSAVIFVFPSWRQESSLPLFTFNFFLTAFHSPSFQNLFVCFTAGGVFLMISAGKLLFTLVRAVVDVQNESSFFRIDLLPFFILALSALAEAFIAGSSELCRCMAVLIFTSLYVCFRDFIPLLSIVLGRYKWAPDAAGCLARASLRISQT